MVYGGVCDWVVVEFYWIVVVVNCLDFGYLCLAVYVGSGGLWWFV